MVTTPARPTTPQSTSSQPPSPQPPSQQSSPQSSSPQLSPQLDNRGRPKPTIAWVKPPADFKLDDTPVDNTAQPLLAGALQESLEITGRIQPENLVATNFGLCAKVNNELTLKAPDWLYVPRVNQPGLDRKTYTPQMEGDGPSVVMEFISETEGGEYSIRQVPPIGKWYFYEEVLQVPTYVIFEPEIGLLEVYRWRSGRYELELPDENGRHWFAELNLFLGPWQGKKEGRSGYWLRWWDAEATLLPWAVEIVDQIETERQRADAEQQRADAEQQRADAERQRADQLATLLREQGIDPDTLLQHG
jgi:Putative restriction endonuclease